MPFTCNNGFPDRSANSQNPTGPNRERAGQRHILRRAWDSNPQVLSDNGFQVMNTASLLLLPTPVWAYLSR